LEFSCKYHKFCISEGLRSVPKSDTRFGRHDQVGFILSCNVVNRASEGMDVYFWTSCIALSSPA
jgi:hypothetical protein